MPVSRRDLDRLSVRDASLYSTLHTRSHEQGRAHTGDLGLVRRCEESLTIRLHECIEHRGTLSNSHFESGFQPRHMEAGQEGLEHEGEASRCFFTPRRRLSVLLELRCPADLWSASPLRVLLCTSPSSMMDVEGQWNYLRGQLYGL